MKTTLTPRTPCVPSRPAGLRGAFACVVILVAVAACRDAPTDPLMGLVAEEAGGALVMGLDLPDPSGWGTSALDGEAARAVDAWHRSWDLPHAEARQLRASAYPVLARVMADQVSREVLTRETAALGEGVRRAQVLDVAQLPPHVAAGLLEASKRYEAATAALARGDSRTLLEALLRGGDALREVGPEAVARDLVFQVEAAFGRLLPDDPYSEQDLERLKRLIHGGREAVGDGDWVLAIRRAYYAKGLLSEAGRDPS